MVSPPRLYDSLIKGVSRVRKRELEGYMHTEVVECTEMRLYSSAQLCSCSFLRHDGCVCCYVNDGLYDSCQMHTMEHHFKPYPHLCNHRRCEDIKCLFQDCVVVI